MANVEITTNFSQKLARLDSNLQRKIKKKIKWYKIVPEDDLFENIKRRKFGPNWSVLRYDHLNIRFPVQMVEFELKTKKTKVFFILDLLKKGESPYNDIEDATKKDFRIKYFNKMKANEEEQNKVYKWLLKKEVEEGKLPELPDDLKTWLGIERKWFDGEDIWILESLNWVEKTQQSDFKNKDFIKVHDSLGDYFINGRTSFDVKFQEVVDYLSQYPNLQLIRNENVWILFETIFSPDNKIYYFLYDYQLSDSPIDLIKYDSLIESLYLKRNNLHDFSGYAYRTYPDYILADKEVWKDIEEDDKTNLALSSEELKVLYETNLPVFINGQAGSGKSTILYYLFADYLFEKISNNLQGKPIFLTFSEALIKDAQVKIVSIYKTFTKYLNKKRKIIPQIIKKLDDYFRQYNHLLIDILNNYNKIPKSFKKDHLIDFNKFRKLYRGESINDLPQAVPCKLSQNKKYSAEIAWHVIRTYIKGYNIDGELTPEEYQNITDEDQTVTVDTYKEIYETIWRQWYKKYSSEYQLWDQQDLTLQVINLLNDKKIGKQVERFPAIFCDEAQDFTRVELEFILRISGFYGYNLQHIEEIPLAFAGDPFQTINPTGFRWEFLESTFYTKFKELNFPVKITEKNLNINFRSYDSIVKFANLIQFYRQQLIDSALLRKVTPQESGIKISEGAPPLIFTIGEVLTEQDLKNIIQKGNIIIIPTEYDGEEEYIKTHPQYFPQIENYDNIFSPLKVKGMEYGKIIILNFGEEYGELFENLDKFEIDKNKEIQLQYLLNKLYVSVTRAKKNLYFIDTPEGIKKLWGLFSKEKFQYFRKKSQDKEIQEKWNDEVIGFYTKGSRPNLSELMDADLYEISEELRKAGEASNNPELLIRAAHFYHKNNDINNQLRSLARANELQGKYKEAGLLWNNPILGQADKAKECFWKGMCWKELSEYCQNNPGSENDFFYLISKFMLHDDEKNFVRQLEKVFQADLIKKVKPYDKTWNKIINMIKRRFERQILKGNIITQKDFLRISVYLEDLAQKGFPQFYNIIAKYFFSLKDYESAVKYWEKYDPVVKSNQYYKAKFYLTDNPEEKIKYAQHMDNNLEILNVWKKNINYPFSRDTLKSVKLAFRKGESGKDLDYLKFVINNFNALEDIEEVIGLYEQKEYNDLEIEQKIIEQIFSNPKWYEFIGLLKDKSVLQRNVEYIIEKILTDSEVFPGKVDVALDYLADLHDKQVNIDPELLLRYIYTNCIYLMSFKSKVNVFLKEKFLEKYLQEFVVKEGEKNEKHLGFQKPYFNNDWMYVIGACIVNNDDFYFIDRIYIVRKIIDYSFSQHNKELNDWAKKVWLYLQNNYIKRRIDDLGWKETQGITEKDKTQHNAKTGREKHRLESKLKEWKMEIPKSISECPFDIENLYTMHPFKEYPENATIKSLHSFHQLICDDGYVIKIFKEDNRILINNDELDVNIKILPEKKEIKSMSDGFRTCKRENGKLNFSIKEKNVKGSLGKRGLIELSLDQEMVKIQL